MLFAYPRSITQKDINWNIRVLGIDQENVLHSCTFDPFECPTEYKPIIPPNLQSLKGYYKFNYDNIICR